MFPDFHLIRPFYLLTLVFPLVTLWWLWRRSVHREKAWAQACDHHLLPHLLVNLGRGQKRALLIWLGIGWFLAVLALVGPTWSKQPQAMYRLQPAKVLILDLSKSMDTSDISPSRLIRAKHKIGQILQRSQSSQIALLVFAGDVHIVSPLTHDIAFIESMLPVLNTQMPVLGRQTDLALATAVKLLAQGGVNQGGEIILITDGLDDKATTLNEARALQAKGHQLSVLAIGTFAPSSPEPVSLTRQFLKKLATTGGGIYTELTPDEADINRLLQTTWFRGEMMTQQYHDWQERGYWFLLPLLLLAAFSFRRGWLFSLLLIIMVLPQVSYALNWQDLWQRPDQQAAKILAQEKPLNQKPAAEMINQLGLLEWQGIVYYRAGEYQKAVDIFAQLNTARAHYNRGNVLVRLEKLAEAKAAYQQALAQNPTHREAQHNLTVVEHWLEQTQSTQKTQPQEKPKPSEDKAGGQRMQGGPQDSQLSSSTQAPSGEQTDAQGASIAGQPKLDSPPEPPPLPPNAALTLEQWLQRIHDNPGELWSIKLEHHRQKFSH